MAGPCCPAGAPRAATSSLSATKEPSVTRSNSGPSKFRFSKSARILRSADFRKVYSEGTRVSGRYFAAFCLARAEQDGPKVGFTVPRAVGKSVLRNRIKRRLRESVRLQLHKLAPEWAVVFNPRHTVADAPFDEICAEVRKVFERCGQR